MVPTCSTLENRYPASLAPHRLTMAASSRLLEGCSSPRLLALQCRAWVAHTDPMKAVVPCSSSGNHSLLGARGTSFRH